LLTDMPADDADTAGATLLPLCTARAIVAFVGMIKRLAIEAGGTGFDHDHLAVIEGALRQAADEIARERAIERCLGDGSSRASSMPSSRASTCCAVPLWQGAAP
jgi:hypothetical protein